MIEIKTPDGGVAQFPDGTPDETITSVLRKEYGGPAQEPPSVAQDIATTLPGKLLQGVAAIPGAVGDVPHMLKNFTDIAYGQTMGRVGNYIDHGTWERKPAEQVAAETRAAQEMAAEQSGIPRVPDPWEVINTQKILDAVEPVTGKLPEPQTTAGKYAGAVASMAPAAAMGGGSLLQRAGQAVVPGVASEAAGQAFEGTAAEPWARALAAITAGGATALTSRKGVPEQMTTQALGALDEATLIQAARLRLEARQRGIELTWPESIQHVSGGATRLPDLQRVVENSEGGGAHMRDFYAERPFQIKDAAQAEFQQIAPNPLPPENLGPRVQTAAQARIDEVTGAINNQTRPLYNAAEQHLVPANTPILGEPAYIQTVREIRADPILGPQFAHLADNSVGMIDGAQKIMRSRAEGLKVPGKDMDTYKSSIYSDTRRQVTNEAKNVSPEYDAAVQWQKQLRQQHLAPLTEGPTGKAAGTVDVGAQTRAIFPDQPQARSEAGVAKAIRGIGRTDQQAAEGVVRQHLETQFNEATQKIQSGQNPYGGAKFASIISGNPQQRKNLIAALKQLPNGSELWRGFSKFLDVLEATGKRPAPNSMTQFNAQITKEFERGGLKGEAIALAAAPQKALTFVSDAYKRFRLGKGTAQLARLFTDGNLDDFRVLLQHGPESPKAIAAAIRLIGQINAASGASAN